MMSREAVGVLSHNIVAIEGRQGPDAGSAGRCLLVPIAPQISAFTVLLVILDPHLSDPREQVFGLQRQASDPSAYYGRDLT
jgi:hypothetical protein